MDSIRLKNYRSLEDTGDIVIKPLTFLLGANSSGKSSFLKILPLIKQSANNTVYGSFLWNGSLVDLKDFQNVVRNGSGDITMEFTLRNLLFLHQRYWIPHDRIPSLHLSFDLSIKEERWDFLKQLKIVANNISIEVRFKAIPNKGESVESFVVNGIDFSNKHDYIKAVSYIGILPRLVYKNKERLDDESEISYEEISKLFSDVNVQDQYAIRRLIMELPAYIIAGKDVSDLIKKRLGKDAAWDKAKNQELINLTLYYSTNCFIDSINEYFSCFAKNIIYVAPLRANFERYYRFQNFSVDSIDSDGHNLAMFLNSLGEENMNRFNLWLSRVFKFEIRLTPSVGHVAIELKEQNKDFRNLVDLGFGYTEMLPILAMIWKDVEYDKNERHRSNDICSQHTFAIEQPELHLHPRFQAKFAQMLVNVINDAKAQKYDIRFIIETHSDVIINKIGQLIDRKQCVPSDVNVVLFNALNEGMENYVECTHYSEDGYIVDWPYGFFDEEDNVD